MQGSGHIKNYKMKKLLFILSIFFTVNSLAQTPFTLTEIQNIWSSGQVPRGVNNSNTWKSLWDRSEVPLTFGYGLTRTVNTIVADTTIGAAINKLSTQWYVRSHSVAGSGTTNYVPKFTGSTTVGNSQIFDNGSNVGIHNASPDYLLNLIGRSSADYMGIEAVEGHGRFLGGNESDNGIIYLRNSSSVYTTIIRASGETFLNAGGSHVTIGSATNATGSNLEIHPVGTDPLFIMNKDNHNAYYFNTGATQNYFAGYNVAGSTQAFNIIGGTGTTYFNQDGNVAIGSTSASGKLTVTGNGSTSGTINFVLKNSSNTELFKVLDDGTATLNGNPLDGTMTGTFSAVGAVTTTFTVTIGVTEPNTTYVATITARNPLSAAVYYVTNKTTTTFDVVYLAGLTGAVLFDWVVNN